MEELEDGWTAHQAPSGHTYYYNATTKKSTYTKPVKTIDSAATRVPPPPPPPPIDPAPYIDESVRQLSALDAQTGGTTSKTDAEQRDRPRYKEAIPTARPWLLVTTKQGRIFYHNPETLESHWSKPEAIVAAIEEWETEALDRNMADASQDEGYEEEFEPEVRPDAEAENVEFDEQDIAWQLAAMEQEGVLPAEQDDEDDVPFEERQNLFQKMLEDCDVDPYSTWDAEVEKIASDPRYLVLDSTKARRAVFDLYCIETAKKRAKEKDKVYKKPAKQAFIELVVQQRTKLVYWQDFKRKFKKSEEYKACGATDNEREKLFRQIHEHLKRSQVQREKDYLALLESKAGEPETDPRWHVLSEEQRRPIEEVFSDRQRY